MTHVQPLRLREEILAVADIKSTDEHIPRATALKQFLYDGVEDYLLRLCSQGRISIDKASELLQKSIYDLQESAKHRGIELGASREEYIKAKKIADLL